jgi:hypothetical protein
MTQDFFGAIPNRGNGGDVVGDVNRMMDARARIAAQGGTPPPLISGGAPVYGSDGNRNAAEAMGQAGQQTMKMAGWGLAALGFAPGAGAPLVMGANALADFMQGNPLGVVFNGVGVLASINFRLGLGPARAGADAPVARVRGKGTIEFPPTGGWKTGSAAPPGAIYVSGKFPKTPSDAINRWTRSQGGWLDPVTNRWVVRPIGDYTRVASAHIYPANLINSSFSGNLTVRQQPASLSSKPGS